MGTNKKPDTQAPEQEIPGQEIPGQEIPGQEIPGQETPGQGAPEQETLEYETKDRLPLQYAVSAENGLNLRQSPSLDAHIVTVLPCGVGVFDGGCVQNGWMLVSTGKLDGWVRTEYLEPLWV